MEALYLDCAGHRLQLMRVSLGGSAPMWWHLRRSNKQVHLAARSLRAALRKLLPQVKELMADDWGTDTERRLRDYAHTVIADLDAGRFEADDPSEALIHLSQLGTDLCLHQTLSRVDIATWNHSLAITEAAACALRDSLRKTSSR